MHWYRDVVFPLIARGDAETAHDRAIRVLELAQSMPGGLAVLRRIAGNARGKPVSFCGLTFPNSVGVAAGFDKDARVVEALMALGFGHVEVGTLTPRSQAGNPKPRVFRLREDRALINRMGFPNGGVKAALPRLAELSRMGFAGVLGVSIGKQKETPLEEAARDYVEVLGQVYPFAGYIAANISSPNTPGLRELQGGKYLESLCKALVAERDRLTPPLARGGGIVDAMERRDSSLDLKPRKGTKVPVLVKIAPDMTEAEVEEIVGVCVDSQIDGMIATNTTLSREGLRSRQKNETGGCSGAPLQNRSMEIIKLIKKYSHQRIPIIGVGGVFTSDDVRRKMDAGATLVQVYTGMVYRGPGIVKELLR